MPLLCWRTVLSFSHYDILEQKNFLQAYRSSVLFQQTIMRILPWPQLFGRFWIFNLVVINVCLILHVVIRGQDVVVSVVTLSDTYMGDPDLYVAQENWGQRPNKTSCVDNSRGKCYSSTNFRDDQIDSMCSIWSLFFLILVVSCFFRGGTGTLLYCCVWLAKHLIRAHCHQWPCDTAGPNSQLSYIVLFKT